MDFKQFREVFTRNFDKVVANDYLFEVDLDKDELVNIYLESFPEGTNEVFRERRWHDCSCCKSFIKQLGGLVTIKNGVVNSIWDFETGDTTYQPVINAMRDYIYSRAIENVFVTKEKKYGVKTNYEKLDNGDILTFEHFYAEIPNKHMLSSYYDTVPTFKGEKKSIKDVFKRSLEEISKDSIETVLDLIAQNSLYRGNEWKEALTTLLRHKIAYDKCVNKDLYAWENSLVVGVSVGKIKNHSIGVLLLDITNDVDLDTAVRRYEAIVAPENYKRPKAIFTKKMIEEAQKKIVELGYMDSLGRRYATLDDITVNNILFCNRDSAKRIKGNVFDEMLASATDAKKSFSRVEEINIETFVKNVLPTVQSVELFLEGKHRNNLMSLIAPENKDSKTMFKWNNNFSWAYSGNIADSSMKERVKSAGGKVDGVLRFSIQWNDIERDENDLDAHCVEPNGNHIYFGSKRGTTGGELDVDIIHPTSKVAVENITWASTSRMKIGTYKFYVKNFNHRGGRKGFRAEIEFNGQIYEFDYAKELRDNEEIHVAKVHFDGVNFTMDELLPSSVGTQNLWGLDTNNFVPVSVIMNSPNYWDEQEGIGNKHYFFMLKDCVNTESPNGFYNEFLDNELMKHKRVFEALGSKMKVEHTEDQLSGLGFSSTKRAELIVRVHGTTTRTLKIKF